MKYMDPYPLKLPLVSFLDINILFLSGFGIINFALIFLYAIISVNFSIFFSFAHDN